MGQALETRRAVVNRCIRRMIDSLFPISILFAEDCRFQPRGVWTADLEQQNVHVFRCSASDEAELVLHELTQGLFIAVRQCCNKVKAVGRLRLGKANPYKWKTVGVNRHDVDMGSRAREFVAL